MKSLNELTKPVVCYGCRIESCYIGAELHPAMHSCGISTLEAPDDFEQGYNQGVLEVLSELSSQDRDYLFKKFKTWKDIWQSR